MRCSRSEFLKSIESWRDSSCAVCLHTHEISHAFVVTFRAASERGVLEFAAHPLLPLTVDLSNAEEFEFVMPERQVKGNVLHEVVEDKVALASVEGKLVFSMMRLVDPLDPLADLVQVPSRPAPKSDAASVEPPIEPEDVDF